VDEAVEAIARVDKGPFDQREDESRIEAHRYAKERAQEPNGRRGRPERKVVMWLRGEVIWSICRAAPSWRSRRVFARS
jgi:hypothetical protein